MKIVSNFIGEEAGLNDAVDAAYSVQSHQLRPEPWREYTITPITIS